MTYDLAIINAKIVTLDNVNKIVEAITISNGKIVKVGTKEQLLKENYYELLDLDGKTIIP